MSYSAAPQDGAFELVAHAHRQIYYGQPDTLNFPDVCACCCGSTGERLTYSKAFRRSSDSDSPNSYVVSTVTVPFCATCIEQHRAQDRPRDRVREVMALFADAEIFGALFPAIAATFVTYLMLGELFRAHWVKVLIFLALAAFFGLIAYSQWLQVRVRTAHLRVAPQTDVTRCFDFSDDLGDSFEASRFECTVFDDRFAAKLRELNPQRIWQAGSPRAERERRTTSRRMWLTGLVLAVLALAGYVMDSRK